MSDEPGFEIPLGDGLELVMPFVCVASNGGEFDDASFLAGFECGAIDAALHMAVPFGAAIQRYVTRDLVEQLDLIAMKHGWRLRLGECSDDLEWRSIEIGPPRDDDESEGDQ